MDRSITISMMWLCTTLLCSVFTERNQFCLVHLQLNTANPSKLHSHQQYWSEQHSFEIASRNFMDPQIFVTCCGGRMVCWAAGSLCGCPLIRWAQFWGSLGSGPRYMMVVDCWCNQQERPRVNQQERPQSVEEFCFNHPSNSMSSIWGVSRQWPQVYDGCWLLVQPTGETP